MSGILYKFGSAPIAWSNKLQAILALSSTEAEYQVLLKAARNVIYLRRLFKELGMCSENPTLILCGNISSIKLVKNLVMHAQTKYIDLHSHFIREKYEDGTICISHVPSLAQQADLLMKPLSPQAFIQNRHAGGIRKYHSKIHSLKP
jgi:hypothetical protein